jgi:hypothetical protein
VIVDIPYLVLHAPPGDGSSSSFVKDNTTCQKIENKIADATSNVVDLAVKIGIAGKAGLFVTTSFEFSVTFNAGLKIQDKSISAEAYETWISVSEGFSTSALTNTEGGGDIFIGYGSDLEELNYENIELFLYSACQPSPKPIASSIFLNVQFEDEVDVTGIPADDFVADFTLYPNPRKGQFTIHFEGIRESGDLSILDISGKAIHTRRVHAGTEAVEFEMLHPDPGFYFVIFKSEQGRITRNMLVE